MTDLLESQTPRQKWNAEIIAAEKELDKFHKRARTVVRRYLDERDAAQASHKWFNIFYANCVILESALYAQLPKPAVTRTFKDYQDDTARVAALIIQRAITQDLDDPRDTFDATMRQAVQDRLVPGLSQAWLRLETDTEDIPVDITPQPGMETEEVGEGATTAEAAEPPQRITDQRVVVDYVFWEDFLWSPCRVWDERRWVARRVYMSKPEMVKRFGQAKADATSFTITAPDNNKYSLNNSVPKEDIIKKCAVYEIWDRTKRKVIWFSKDSAELLDEIDDPLKLTGFEPCPRPMLANVSTSNTAPRPDYYMIQDQYTELDTINNRISMLVQACKVVGVYDKGAIGVQRMLQEGSDNTLIPVDNWAMFAEKGGLKGAVDWLPLDTIVNALQQLNMARDVIKAQIYEITGISDIVRGASKASETLGAQEIKAQFAGVRIQRLQNEVARFAGEILRIKAEIMVKHFTPELLITKSNILATQNDEYVGPAMQMLATDAGFEWRIQVTADSIAQADYQLEKKDRIEFLTAISSYLEKASMMFQAVPGSAALLVGLLKWGVAGFRNASEVEGMLDKELDAITKSPPEDKPDPEAEAAQQKAQQEQQAHEQAMQVQQMKAQAEQQAAQVKQHAAEQQMQIDQQRLTMELQADEQRLQLKMQEDQQKMQFEQAMNEMKLAFEREMSALKLEAAKAQAEAKPAKESSDA